MIVLTKRNDEKFVVNHNQIKCVEMIPETKVIMMNGDYYLVLESVDEIVEKIQTYSAQVMDIRREITIVDRR